MITIDRFQRGQFGTRIDSYGGVQEKIARMSMLHYATESMAYMVAGVMDQGHKEYQALTSSRKDLHFVLSLRLLYLKYSPLKLPGTSLMKLSR